MSPSLLYTRIILISTFLECTNQNDMCAAALVRDCDSVPRLLKRLEEFRKVSKTEAMWLGTYTWKSRMEKPFGFKWPHHPVLALGVHFSYGSERAKKLNLEDKIATLEKLSIVGREENSLLLEKYTL